MKAKHLDKALMQFAEEGAAKVFKPATESVSSSVSWDRCNSTSSPAGSRSNTGSRSASRPSQFTSARWVTGPKEVMSGFVDANKGHIAHDIDGDVVYLTRLQWDIDRVARDYPDLALSETKELQAA